MTAQELRARLDRFPRLPLGTYPTPLQPAPGLSRELGRTVLVKREDLSGLAFGGNKVRHMELLMAEVRRAGADTVLNVMDYHSNNARLAAAACVRAGFRYHVFLRHAAGMPVQGNSLVDHLLGAAVHLLNDDESERDMELARGVAERLRRAGAVPYVMNDELFPKLAGMIGFADAGLELAGHFGPGYVDHRDLYVGILGFKVGDQLGVVVRAPFIDPPLQPGNLDYFLFHCLTAVGSCSSGRSRRRCAC